MGHRRPAAIWSTGISRTACMHVYQPLAIFLLERGVFFHQLFVISHDDRFEGATDRGDSREAIVERRGSGTVFSELSPLDCRLSTIASRLRGLTCTRQRPVARASLRRDPGSGAA